MYRCRTHWTYQSNAIIFIILLATATAFRTPSELSPYLTRGISPTFRLSSSSLGQIVKGNKIQAYGHVTECRGGTAYLVQIDNSDRTVLCELGGSLYRRRKLITLNARVKIEVHLLAPNKGRIIERLDSYDTLFTISRGVKEPPPEGKSKDRHDSKPQPEDPIV